MTKSSKDRAVGLQRVHGFYRCDEAGLGGKCVYCGQRSETKDHIPPVSLASEMDLENLKGLDPVLVPACHQCNFAIGDSLTTSLSDRRELICQYLQKKYPSYIKRGIEITKDPSLDRSDWNDQAAKHYHTRWLFASLEKVEVGEPPEPEQD